MGALGRMLCAGCPYRAELFAVKRVFTGLVASGKVFYCGFLGACEIDGDRMVNEVDACVRLGEGASIGDGLKAAKQGSKVVAFAGDSSSLDCLLPDLADAFQDGPDVTLCVFCKPAVSEGSLSGEPSSADGQDRQESSDLASLRQVLQQFGIAHIMEADVFDYHEALSAARSAINYHGPAAVLFAGSCAREEPNKPPASISLELCTGCSACMNLIECPAMELVPRGDSSKNRVMRIDPALCSGCGLCVPLCPCWAIACDAASGKHAAAAGAAKASTACV